MPENPFDTNRMIRRIGTTAGPSDERMAMTIRGRFGTPVADAMRMYESPAARLWGKEFDGMRPALRMLDQNKAAFASIANVERSAVRTIRATYPALGLSGMPAQADASLAKVTRSPGPAFRLYEQVDWPSAKLSQIFPRGERISSVLREKGPALRGYEAAGSPFTRLSRIQATGTAFRLFERPDSPFARGSQISAASESISRMLREASPALRGFDVARFGQIYGVGEGVGRALREAGPAMRVSDIYKSSAASSAALLTVRDALYASPAFKDVLTVSAQGRERLDGMRAAVMTEITEADSVIPPDAEEIARAVVAALDRRGRSEYETLMLRIAIISCVFGALFPLGEIIVALLDC